MFFFNRLCKQLYSKEYFFNARSDLKLKQATPLLCIKNPYSMCKPGGTFFVLSLFSTCISTYMPQMRGVSYSWRSKTVFELSIQIQLRIAISLSNSENSVLNLCSTSYVFLKLHVLLTKNMYPNLIFQLVIFPICLFFFNGAFQVMFEIRCAARVSLSPGSWSSSSGKSAQVLENKCVDFIERNNPVHVNHK